MLQKLVMVQDGNKKKIRQQKTMFWSEMLQVEEYGASRMKAQVMLRQNQMICSRVGYGSMVVWCWCCAKTWLGTLRCCANQNLYKKISDIGYGLGLLVHEDMLLQALLITMILLQY